MEVSKGQLAVVAVALIMGGAGIGYGIAGLPSARAESTINVPLSSFCPNNHTVQAWGFIHDDDAQRASWLYVCLSPEGAVNWTVPR